MRIVTAILIGTLLLATACGDGGDEVATVESVPATVEDTAATATPEEVAVPTIEESTPITDSTLITGTEEFSTVDDLTATEAISGVENITGVSVMTDTPAMTATGEITAPMAQTILLDAEGNSVGDATFTETDEGVMIQVTLREFTAAAEGEHGIHIHTTGACTPDFQAAGGHFNPTDAQHGLENSAGPHAGDLPNLEVDADGNAIYEATDTMITLGNGEGSLFDEDGSALVIHSGPDDMVTDPSGDSGDRIACGVIEMQ